MFDKCDEEARKIVNDFFDKYNISKLNVMYSPYMVEPKVYMLSQIAKALREARKEKV